MTRTEDFERLAFEKWLCERPDYWGRNLADREEDGTYKYGEVENHWLAWQARAALASPVAVSDSEILDAAWQHLTHANGGMYQSAYREHFHGSPEEIITFARQILGADK